MDGRGPVTAWLLAPSAGAPVASLFGLTTTQALVVLFVLLPFALAAVIVPLVAWRWSKGPRPVLTSEILARGVPAEAEILSVRPLGTILDVRPMVRFQLLVTSARSEERFELEVVQSLPRAVLRDFKPGDIVEIRLTEDHAAGAIVWAGAQPGRGPETS